MGRNFSRDGFAAIRRFRCGSVQWRGPRELNLVAPDYHAGRMAFAPQRESLRRFNRTSLPSPACPASPSTSTLSRLPDVPASAAVAANSSRRSCGIRRFIPPYADYSYEAPQPPYAYAEEQPLEDAATPPQFAPSEPSPLAKSCSLARGQPIHPRSPGRPSSLCRRLHRGRRPPDLRHPGRPAPLLPGR